MRIALLEDDPDQARLIGLWLGQAGHQCTAHARAQSLMTALRDERPDLVLLDWEVPDLSGPEMLRWMLETLAEPPPVIFTTAHGDESDMAGILNLGADDYLVKPLRQQELLARVAAVGRRTHAVKADAEAIFSVGPFEIDPVRRILARNGTPIELTRRDFELACYLFRHCGEVVSRDHLLQRVWGLSAALNTRTVDTHASRLRGKLGLDGSSGWHLIAVYQAGYRLEPTPESGSTTMPRHKDRRGDYRP
jgi:DNA-binding response OmpR family regulator